MNLLLIAIAAMAAYVLLVLASPTGRCWRCKGTRIDRRGKRPRACRACWVTGRRYRPGAKFIHRLFWSLFGDHLRGRRLEALRQREQAGTAPGPRED